MPVLAHIEGEARHGVRRIVRNAVSGKNPGVCPHAVTFRFLNQKLSIRADHIEIFFYDIVPIQDLFLHHESVAFFTGMLADIVRHDVQRFLFAVALNAFAHIRILKSNWQGYMDMAVDDAGHDEFSTEIGNFAIIGRKTGLVAHIDEFAVLYRKSSRLRIVLVRCENLRVLDDLICLHAYSPFV